MRFIEHAPKYNEIALARAEEAFNRGKEQRGHAPIMMEDFQSKDRVPLDRTKRLRGERLAVKPPLSRPRLVKEQARSEQITGSADHRSTEPIARGSPTSSLLAAARLSPM